MNVLAVCLEGDFWHAGIRLEDDPFAGDSRLEAEGRVFVVQMMIVAAGHQRSDRQGRRPAHRRNQPPAQGDQRQAMHGQQLLLDARPILELENPARAGGDREAFDPVGPVGKDGSPLIALRGDGVAAGSGFDPGFQAVDQHHSARRGRSGGQQQGVISAGPLAADRSRGESAQSVGFEPFGEKIHSGRAVLGWCHGDAASFIV